MSAPFLLLAQTAASPSQLSALAVGLALAILLAHGVGFCIWIVGKLRASGHDTAADFVENDLEPVVKLLVDVLQKTHQGDPEHPAQLHLLELAASRPGLLDHPDVIRALDAPPAR